MNRKQKIFIATASLFCGSPIIFLAFRDNDQQKNNIFIKKKEKKKEKKEQIINHQETNKSPSWIFRIILIVIILIVLTIIFLAIYKNRQEQTKNQKPDKKNDDVFQKNILEIKKPKAEKFKLSKQKGFFECIFILILQPNRYFKFYFSDSRFYEIDKINESFVENILKVDIDDLAGLPQFQKQVKNCQQELKKILQLIIQYFKTYLTGQLLDDVHQNQKSVGDNCAKLSAISIRLLDDNYADEEIYEDITSVNVQEATNNDMKYLNENKPLHLLGSVLNNTKSTFIKKNGSTVFLFQHFFTFYKFFCDIHQDIFNFFTIQIAKKNNELQKYETLLTKLQESKNVIDELIFQKIVE